MIQKKLFSANIDPRDYKNVIYAGVSILALLVLGWFAFHTYKVYQGERAQRILGESLQEFQIAMNTVQPQWSEVQLMTELAGQQTAGAALHPFFLVMQAQAAAQQNKIDEAIGLMQQAINELPSHSPYKLYYVLTKNLMQLDASTDKEKEQGVASLQELAANVENPYRDAALYHLGDYYASLNQDDKAVQVWQELVELAEIFSSSPWVALAQQKLAAA